MIIKFLQKNKDLKLTGNLKNLLEIYNSDIITEKTSDLLKDIFISNGNIPEKLLKKVISTKFDSSCEANVYELIENLIHENCDDIKNQLGNNFNNVCNKVLNSDTNTVPKFVNTLKNNNITLEEDYNKILNEKLGLRFDYFF